MYSLTFQPIARLTPDEMLQFAALNPDLRCEMNPNGSITLKKSFRLKHKSALEKLRGMLENWNNQHQEGEVFNEKIGYILSNGAIRLPVLSWVKKYKTDSHKEHLIQFPPDFVVEFLTESENKAALQMKMKEYIANGCALAWLLDLQNEKVYIFKNSGQDEIVEHFDKILSGIDILKGLEVNLEELIY
jgi:Uma2 family endonuclease